LVRDRYDDGGFSGGSMDRPALQKLLIDVQARRIDVIVVYKVDRLTRSLADFAKLVETFEQGRPVSFNRGSPPGSSLKSESRPW
jgi:DNA invertase Pin-like site-specific DNA recombinase